MRSSSPGHGTAWHRWIALGAGLALLGLALGRLGFVSWGQLAAPFDLNFEAPNLATIDVLRAGGNPYDPALFADVPFVWTLYTPLYHLIVASLPASPDLPFLPGRAVALMAALAAAGMVLLVARGTPGRIAALLATATFLLAGPVTSSAAYLRMDLLALALAGGSIMVLGLWQRRRGERWLIPLAALLALLAVLTKQSYVAAALAGGGWLLLANRRAFAGYAVSGAAGTVVAFGVLTAWGGGGFWTSILVTASHPVTLAHGLLILTEMASSPLIVALLGAGLVAAGGSLAVWRLEAVRGAPFLLFLAAAWLIMLVTVGKVGSSTNYVFEPLLASALLCVWAVDRAPPGFWRAPRGELLAVGIAGLIAVTALVAAPASYSYLPRALWHVRPSEQGGDGRAEADRMRAAYRESAARLLPSTGSILNLATNQLIYERAPDGRPLQDRAYLNDVFLYASIFASMPPTTLEAALRAARFDLVVTARHHQVGMAPVPAVEAALRDGYVVAAEDAFVYWRPKQGGS